MSRASCLLLLPLLVGLSACFDVDGFVFGGVPCSTVGPDTCEEIEIEWDRACLPCEARYDWGEAFPWEAWFPRMLADGRTIRPIDGSIDGGAVVRTVVPTDDGLGELDTYFVPAHGEDASRAQTTVFYNHGNYIGVEHYVPRVRVLYELGFNVFIWDYRGYGKSLPTAPPTDLQFLDDARQMRAFVSTLAPDPDRIVAYGYSLGSIPAVEASVADPGCALLLESPFTGAAGILRDGGLAWPESYLSGGRYHNAAKIRAYEGPLFVMVGEDDGFFSPETIRPIYENAPTAAKEFWVLPGVDHGVSTGGVPEDGLTQYDDRIRAFLEANAPACLTAD